MSVGREPFQVHRDFAASVEPDQNRLAEITTLVRGRVVEVLVDSGQDVKAGTILARLYSSELGMAQSAHLKAKAKLHEARLAYERGQDLTKDGAMSQAALQRLAAEYETAQAEAKDTQNRLEVTGMQSEEISALGRERRLRPYIPIRSPFSGRVIMRNITQGEILDTSHKVFAVADLSDVWVIASVPEKDIRMIHPGQAVDVTVPAYGNETFKGNVTLVGDLVDTHTRTLRVRVTVPNPERRLKPGMFATVRVYGDVEQGGLVVPLEAMERDGGRHIVFVRRDPEHFEERAIEVGARNDNKVLVLKGLQEGEQVVVSGAIVLKTELAKQHEGDLGE